MSITIQLTKFEGPLDLLLYLIRKEEMDIFDIKINQITGQYLDYIKLMKELDLEVAGEFIAMAATLIHIKSRMLLPQYDENGEIIEQEDPRKELVQRLLEYQKYQEAAKSLYERPLLGRDTWARGTRERLDAKEDEIILEENALFALISAYRNALKSVKSKVHQVTAKAQSIASRILQIKDRLIIGQKTAMSDLIDSLSDKKTQVLITFLSILELGKMGFVALYQSDTYQEIYIEATKAVDEASMSRVEEYDSMRADEVAAAMMDKAQKIDDNFDLDDDEFAVSADGDGNIESESLGEDEEVVDAQEIASDEEILAAEMELDNNNGDMNV